MKKIPLPSFLLLAPLLLLSGCNLVVMSPSGDIAMQQRNLIIFATVLMLIIIVPVILMVLFFAWRYRASNTSATYLPDWHHSTKIELVVWSAPIAIIIVLASATWIYTHKLDPYRPIDRIDAQTPLPAGVKPLEVDVVAMDWKWLFIYPELGVATVNELAAPLNVPIDFKITSQSVMNSFFIPALAGQIYAMPGMQTELHAVINKPGVFEGFSANYSGAGFSHMRFKFHGLSADDFKNWVAKVKNDGIALNRDTYLKLAKPSESDPVRYFAYTDKALFNDILNLCVEPGKMCMSQMMHIDSMGGAGKDSEGNVKKLQYDNRGVDLSVSPPNGNDSLSQADTKPSKMVASNKADDTTQHTHMNHSMPGMNMPDSDNGAAKTVQTN
ncbi:ubiquinol oxidase subunit II [Allorhizobium sp. BGMRC 0089]|uniref:ubiquinol oxidase subunit II n=1 Tax=Allorhizobium sonneratiae TaxID=2934936 RepID=UPI0020335783|nr:ubiquinol oxidase subunit II [Allorhizobium sonneratiae]MCM2293226.1 ubiquinol oxidase subunit II [Allorhizobium sonneratiae]